MAERADGIVFTQSGQSGPYADLVFAGTVEAESEAMAKAKLARYRGVESIGFAGDSEWYLPYFREFCSVASNVWRFRIVEAYTG